MKFWVSANLNLEFSYTYTSVPHAPKEMLQTGGSQMCWLAHKMNEKNLNLLTFISQEISPKNLDFQLLLKIRQILAIEKCFFYSTKIKNYKLIF